MVHKGHAYIGHMFSNGVTIVNVTDPKNSKPVNYLPTPPNTWALHLQTQDDLLLVINAVNLFGSSLYANEAEYYSKSITETFGQQSRDFSHSILN